METYMWPWGNSRAICFKIKCVKRYNLNLRENPHPSPYVRLKVFDLIQKPLW